jgi:hypothetical protein
MSARDLPLDPGRAWIPQLSELRAGELALAVGASVLGGCVLAATSDWIAFAVLGLAFIVGLGVLRPSLFLVLLLLGRPLVDGVSEVTIGVRSANLGGALAVTLIVATALVAVRMRRVAWPEAATMLVLALAVSAVSAVQAVFAVGSAAGLEALAEVLRIAALLAAYVLAASLFGNPRKARLLFLVVGLAGVLPAVLGIGEWIGGPPVVEELGRPRISGPFTGPGAFGIFLAVSALIVLFLPRGQLRPWLRYPAVIIMVVALVGSLSRDGWVIFAAGVVLLGWRGRKPLLIVVVVVLVGLVALVPAVHERTLPASTPAARASLETTYSSWYWRRDNWIGLLHQWAERPVFGYGLRTTRYVNTRAPVATLGEVGGGFDAHNLAVRLRSVWRRARSPGELRSLGRLLLVIWTLLVITGLTTDDPLAGTAVMLGLLALTGSLDAAHQAVARPGVK